MAGPFDGKDVLQGIASGLRRFKVSIADGLGNVRSYFTGDECTESLLQI